MLRFSVMYLSHVHALEMIVVFGRLLYSMYSEYKEEWFCRRKNNKDNNKKAIVSNLFGGRGSNQVFCLFKCQN